MGKRDFEQGGGLDSLFAKGKSSTPKTEEQPQEETPQAQTEESLSGRADILSTIEDAELRAALRAKRMEGRGRPRKGQNRESLSLGYTRACLWVNEEKYSTLRDIALRETKTVKDIVEYAFDLVIEKYREEGKL